MEQNKETLTKDQNSTSRYKKISKTNPFPYNYREWLPELSTETIQKTLSNPNRLIRVINYNILSDSLLPISTKIKESEIEKLPYLKWENRSIKVLEELQQLNGDILCIEEIEKDEKYLIPTLSSMGYEFAFKPRTGNHSEGCALSWKKEKFDLIDLLAIEYNMNKTNKDISPVFDRDNVGLIGILGLKGVDDCIILATVTHLVFNKNRGDIKLGQIYQLVKSIDFLKKKYENEKKKVYVILGGDMNSTPKSGIYKLLTTGELNCEYVDKYKLSGQDPENLQYVNSKRVKPYLLKSIASKYKGDIKPSVDENSGKPIKNYMVDNVKWYNEICRIEPDFSNPHSITLKYDEKYRYKDYDIILKLPFKFMSAYSSLCSNVISFIDEPNGKLKKTLPFSLIQDVKELDNIEINGIKMGVAEIKKTISFISGLTLDIPLTSYNSNTLMSSDYIFYHGEDMKVIRILNIPDIHKIVFDVGFMPTNEFPSDHFSIGADFVLGE